VRLRTALPVNLK